MAAAQDPERVDEILGWSIPIMFVLYAFLLAATLYNTFKFLLKEQRYRNFHIMYFYVLVVLVALLRITWLSLILVVV